MTEQCIELGLIDDNPFQHREMYKDIDSLARTIAVNGLEQKPRARQVDGRYQLVEGHRRKRAFDWANENWKKENLPERYNGYTVMPLEVEEVSDRQMFEGMVIENVHRDDLKPTEVAHLLQEYQTQFPEATSKQIGLVFGMNDATVRGMVRLLELPQTVQVALDAGKISQGTARMFHSMQKIAPEEKIKQALRRIEKEAGNSLPEEVIEDEIDNLENAVELWSDHRDGKPRGGYHGWLLDMKNFPNKHLPVLNGRAANLPMEQLEHLTNPPSCAACPFYTRVRGNHYCGVKLCFERKTAAWVAHNLEQVSKQVKIAVYSEADGAWRNLGWNDRTLFESRHADLRLMAGSTYQSFAGIDDDLVTVVATGAALDKLTHSSGKTSGGKKTEKEKAEMRAMKLYRARRKDVMWEYSAVAQGMFEKVSEPVLKKLQGWKYIQIDDRIPDEKVKSHESRGAEYQRRVLVWHLIMDLSSHNRRESLNKQLEAFQKQLGVKAPRALITQVAQWESEIEAAAKPVSVETQKAKK